MEVKEEVGNTAREREGARVRHRGEGGGRRGGDGKGEGRGGGGRDRERAIRKGRSYPIRTLRNTCPFIFRAGSPTAGKQSVDAEIRTPEAATENLMMRAGEQAVSDCGLKRDRWNDTARLWELRANGRWRKLRDAPACKIFTRR